MAWGYERSFTIEHDTTLKKKIDCKDCVYYERDDKSCMKRPLYLPVDGYNSWRRCKYFELDESTSNYGVKKVQYAEVLKKKAKEQMALKNTKIKAKATPKKTNCNTPIQKKYEDPKTTNKKTIYAGTRKTGIAYKNRGYTLYVIDNNTKLKGMRFKLVEVQATNGKVKKVQVAFDDVSYSAYVNGDIFPKKLIEKVRSAIR